MSASKITNRLCKQLTAVLQINSSSKVAASSWRNNYSSQSVTTLEGAPDLRSGERSWEALPGPRSLPFIGTLYKYLPGGEYNDGNRTNSEWKKFQKYGEIVKEEIFPGEVFIHLYHPDDIEEVYRKEGKYPFRGELRALAKYNKDKGMDVNFANSKGEKWGNVRFPTAKEMLNPKLVSSYMVEQNSVARDLVTVMKVNQDPSGQLAMMTELNKYAIEALSVVLFNKRLGILKSELEEDGARLFNAVHRSFEGLYHCTFFWPLHKSGKSKIWKQYAESLDFMYKISGKLVQKNLQSTKEKQNFIQRLTARGVGQEQATEVTVAILFGGIDTTSTSIFFLLYNLAKNQDKQEILYQSIRAEFPCRDSSVTAEGVGSLQYLRACMKESFRLTPTSTGTLRILDKDIVLRNYRIPAGRTIQLHNAVVSKREDIFVSPSEYIPERWLKDYSPKVHPFATVPFSHGTRNCVGRRFSEQEIILAAIQILQHFKVEYEGPPVIIKTNMLAYPSRDVLKFTDRE